MAILDSVTNEKVAYSLRKLRDAYAGSAVKIRRDDDNVEADIGFDGSGDFDVDAYNTHLAASPTPSTIGFVTTWYDQSGAGLDMVQTSATLQPRISLSNFGPNNRPVILWGGLAGGEFLVAADLSALTAAEVFSVIRVNTDPPVASNDTGHWNFGSASLSTHYPFTNSKIFEAFGSTSRQDTGDPTPSLATERVYNVITVSGEFTVNIDDTEHFTTATNTVGFETSSPRYGASGSSHRLDGVTSELIIFDAKLSGADHSTVFDNLQAYYLVVAAGLVPYPNPRYSLHAGMQSMEGGV